MSCVGLCVQKKKPHGTHETFSIVEVLYSKEDNARHIGNRYLTSPCSPKAFCYLFIVSTYNQYRHQEKMSKFCKAIFLWIVWTNKRAFIYKLFYSPPTRNYSKIPSRFTS